MSATGRRVRFTRDVGNITMKLSDLEEIDTLAGRGADTFAIGDLSGTPVELVDISLAPGFGFPGGDGRGGPRRGHRHRRRRRARRHRPRGRGRHRDADRPAGEGQHLTHTEGASDTLAIDTRAGDDTVDTSGLADGTIGLEVD